MMLSLQPCTPCAPWLPLVLVARLALSPLAETCYLTFRLLLIGRPSHTRMNKGLMRICVVKMQSVDRMTMNKDKKC